MIANTCIRGNSPVISQSIVSYQDTIGSTWTSSRFCKIELVSKPTGIRIQKSTLENEFPYFENQVGKQAYRSTLPKNGGSL